MRLGRRSLFLAASVLLAASVAAPGFAGDDARPTLPAGACDGEWKQPKVVVGFGEIAKSPYEPRFRPHRITSRAYDHPTFADFYPRRVPNATTFGLIFTRKPAARAREFRAVAVYPGNLRFLRACYSGRDLERIQRVVGRELMWTDDPALELNSTLSGTDIDAKKNRVVVHLNQHSEEDEAQIEGRYGPVVSVYPGDVPLVPAG